MRWGRVLRRAVGAAHKVRATAGEYDALPLAGTSTMRHVAAAATALALHVWLASLLAFALAVKPNEGVCEAIGVARSYPSLEVGSILRFREIEEPLGNPEGTCSLFCRDDHLFFKDDAGGEKAVTLDEMKHLDIRGSYGELMRLTRTTPSMASHLTLSDKDGATFESRIGHEGSSGTGLFGGGSKYSLAIGTKSDHAISFHTSGKALPRLFIDKDGKVGVGRLPSTNVFEVDGEASKATAGSWLVNSDARIKRDVERIATREALDKVMALRPVSYAYVDAYRHKHPSVDRRERWVSFIAQEYAAIFPDAVVETKDVLEDAHGNVLASNILQVDVHDATIHLVAALQEQQKQIEALRLRVDALSEGRREG